MLPFVKEVVKERVSYQNLKNRLWGVLIVLSLAIAICQLGQAMYLSSKATLAQFLIAQAWQEQLLLQEQSSLAHSNAAYQAIKPWPWADTWPVARLQYQKEDIKEDLYILAGADGSSLAFGPGHQFGTAHPGVELNADRNNYSIVGGHRDTHFRFLQYVNIGDTFRVQNQSGQWQVFKVTRISVHNSLHKSLMIQQGSHALYLITCYPFDALTAGGPLRYVVEAVRA